MRSGSFSFTECPNSISTAMTPQLVGTDWPMRSTGCARVPFLLPNVCVPGVVCALTDSTAKSASVYLRLSPSNSLTRTRSFICSLSWLHRSQTVAISSSVRYRLQPVDHPNQTPSVRPELIYHGQDREVGNKYFPLKAIASFTIHDVTLRFPRLHLKETCVRFVTTSEGFFAPSFIHLQKSDRLAVFLTWCRRFRMESRTDKVMHLRFVS